MLAYLFWHWPREGVEAWRYEDRQAAFHASLREDPPAGMQGSACYQVDCSPWGALAGPLYEDWYRVGGFGDLEALNEGAVAARRRGAHDAAAGLAAGGAGGVYRLLAGEPLPRVTHAYWFARPEGMGYGELREALLPLAEAGASVWMRQMVLGPAPEFCVRAEGRLELPAGIEAEPVALRIVWGGR